MSNLIENRQIRIFISSTFKDLKDERDYLIAKVFPSLRRYCEERDITLFELDLRWGITEEESKQGKVVEICLQEIKNTRPFFIGILGESYGSALNEATIDKNTNILSDYPWIKDELGKGTSYTEIEIQEGVFRAQEKINAYFYFRSPHVEIPPEFREKNEWSVQKLTNLKNKIREQKQYPVKEFLSKEELGQFVEEDFKKLVNDLFSSGWISELEKERLEQRSYLKSLTQIYVSQNVLEEGIDNFISSKEKALVIIGESGMGKSALLANWIQKNDKENRDPKIIYHFIGLSRLEGNYRKIRQRLINEVRKRYGITQKLDPTHENVSTSKEELSVDEKQRNKLQKYLFSIPKNENLVIILDGIDKLTDKDNAKLLNWLPTYPENVKFIFSTPEDDPIMGVFKRMNFPVISIPILNIENRKRLITDYLLSFGKKLIPSQTDRIANDEESANPMILRALLDELRFVNYHRDLDKEIDRYLAAQSIPDFYIMVLERLERTFDYTDTDASNISMDILSLLYVSRNGLSEAEIIALTRAKPIYWSQMYNALGRNISVFGGLINFSNNYIREAIKRRYFAEKEKEISYRLWIVHYLKTTSNIPEKRTYLELPYQLYYLGDQGGLYRFLKNRNAFSYWIEKDINELGKYCRALKEADKKKISIEMEKELESEIKKSDKNEVADLYYYIGMLIKSLGVNDSLALKFIQQATAIREEIQGKEHEDNGESYNGLGMLHFEKGDYKKALEYYQKALNIFEKASGDKNLNIAIIYNNTGQVYYTMGNYSQALEYYLKALNVFDDKELGALIYNNIGLIYSTIGDYPQAIEYCQKALNIQEEVLGKKHKDTALCYNNIGMLYFSTNDYIKAIEYYQKALNIQEEILGKKHKDTALCYNNIGLAYNSMNNKPKALEYCLLALSIQEEVLGKKHKDTATSYNNVGMGYSQVGDYPKALMYVQQALSIQKEVLGEKHIDTALSYNNIGEINFLIGNYQNAFDYFQQALNIHEDILGKGHPKTIMIRNNLTGFYLKQGIDYFNKNNYDFAVVAYTEAIRINPNYTTAYHWRGNVYYYKKDYAAAINDFTKAIELRKKPDASDYYWRGIAYYRKQNYDAAIDDLAKAIELREKPDGLYYYWRGMAYHYKKDYDAAIKDLTKTIELSNKPNAVDYYWRGQAYYYKKNYNEALKDYNKALEIDPNYEDARKLKQDCQWILESDFATLKFEKIGENITDDNVHQFVKSHYDKLSLQGYKYFDELGKIAGNLYGEFNKLTPDLTMNHGEIWAYSKPHYELLISRGDSLGIMIAFSDINIANEMTIADDYFAQGKDYHRRGRTYYNNKNYDAAIDDFTKAMKLSEKPNVYDYLWRGLAYLNKKDYYSAISDFTKTIELSDKEKNKYVYYFRGLAYQTNGNNNAALKDYDKALEIDPNYEDAKKAKLLISAG
jgi:tetratricopeptide (TPR) repeat protein/ABC-type dipeptide/oligopeptide/nickel transport system ATPase component